MIYTGHVSGIFVVDTDSAQADAWINAKGIPATYKVRTGSGRGHHYYFRAPTWPVKTGGKELHEHIDVRGQGGCVVAAGSPHADGGVYALVSNLPVAEAPAWLLEHPALKLSVRDVKSATDAPRYIEPAHVRIDRARTWVATQEPAREGMPGGAHAHTMGVLSMTARFHGLTEAAHLAEAIADWNARCTNSVGLPFPWTGNELAHKLEEALHRSVIPWCEDPARFASMADASKNIRKGEWSWETCTFTASNDIDARGWMTAAERARRIGGELKRLSTGFPTIDNCTRGGPSLKKVVVVGGAPGAGKTATVVQMAYRWVCQGIHVAVLASDEDADGLLTRFGQLTGLTRDDIEGGKVRDRLAAWCEQHPNLMLVDADDSKVCGHRRRWVPVPPESPTPARPPVVARADLGARSPRRRRGGVESAEGSPTPGWIPAGSGMQVQARLRGSR